MDVFVARQPIFDRQQKVYAYELLFRSSLENFFSHPDPNLASAKVISDSFFLFGMETITGGKRAFINVTRESLLQEYLAMFPKALTVVEILETVEPDEEVIEACRKLKEEGFLLALDDFVYSDRFIPLVDMADIIKVDFLGTDVPERRAMVERFSGRGIKLLAERVETREEFDLAVNLGYDYFQGYFFSKPVILQKKDIPGFKLNYLQIIREINRPELNYDQLEDVIKREVSLSYKLLRYINSPFFGWKREVTSIRHALTLLGDKSVRKWASLVALASMGSDKPEELVTSAVVRAKFCELLAPKTGLAAREEDLFLMGMFSMIDALVDLPLPEILAEIPIAPEIKGALLGEMNPLRKVYDVVTAYERGEWDNFRGLCKESGLDEMQTPGFYLDSIDWTTQIALN